MEEIDNLHEKSLIDDLKRLFKFNKKDFIFNEQGNLIKLKFNSKSLKEIPSCIRQFLNLKWLDLSNNQINKIENLETLQKLQYLNLRDNSISKIKGLQNLIQLEDLSLSENQISKIEGLENLFKLKILDVSHNQIRKIEGLERLSQLEMLFLKNNHIMKIEGLNSLSSLIKLHLDSNNIRNLEGLDNLAKLVELYLEENEIQEIKGLENLTELQELILDENPVNKLGCFEILNNLILFSLNKYLLSEEYHIKYEEIKRNKRKKYDVSFWDIIHKEIVKVARDLFMDGHFKQAVFEAFLQINIRVKEIYRDKTGEEKNGKDLMFRVFNKDNPIIFLGNLNDQTSKDIQEGYMHIFAGSIQGIRNPKAHDIFKVTKEKAIHFIFLASLLMKKIDEALSVQS